MKRLERAFSTSCCRAALQLSSAAACSHACLSDLTSLQHRQALCHLHLGATARLKAGSTLTAPLLRVESSCPRAP